MSDALIILPLLPSLIIFNAKLSSVLVHDLSPDILTINIDHAPAAVFY